MTKRSRRLREQKQRAHQNDFSDVNFEEDHATGDQTSPKTQGVDKVPEVIAHSSTPLGSPIRPAVDRHTGNALFDDVPQNGSNTTSYPSRHSPNTSLEPLHGLFELFQEGIKSNQSILHEGMKNLQEGMKSNQVILQGQQTVLETIGESMKSIASTVQLLSKPRNRENNEMIRPSRITDTVSHTKEQNQYEPTQSKSRSQTGCDVTGKRIKNLTQNTSSDDSRVEISDNSESELSDSNVSSGSLNSRTVSKRRSTTYQTTNKLPPFSGKESWKVWFGRFKVIAERNRWNPETCLDELLPRLHGNAAEFVFEQLSEETTRNYRRLIRELNNRYRVVENKKTYAAQLSRRNQKPNESVEEYAAELKRLYDKAHSNRDFKTRQEDLLRRFFDGLNNERASFEVEFHKEPIDIDQAVFYVVNYEETRRKVYNSEDSDRRHSRKIRRSRRTSWDADYNSSSDEDQYSDKKNRNSARQVISKQKSEVKPNKEVRFNVKQKNSSDKTIKNEDRQTKMPTLNQKNTSVDSKTIDDMNNVKQELLQMIRNELQENQRSGTTDTGRFVRQQKYPVTCCYRCGKPGHFMRDCQNQIPPMRNQPISESGFNVRAPVFQPSYVASNNSNLQPHYYRGKQTESFSHQPNGGFTNPVVMEPNQVVQNSGGTDTTLNFQRSNQVVRERPQV